MERNIYIVFVQSCLKGQLIEPNSIQVAIHASSQGVETLVASAEDNCELIKRFEFIDPLNDNIEELLIIIVDGKVSVEKRFLPIVWLEESWQELDLLLQCGHVGA